MHGMKGGVPSEWWMESREDTKDRMLGRHGKGQSKRKEELHEKSTRKRRQERQKEPIEVPHKEGSKI